MRHIIVILASIVMFIGTACGHGDGMDNNNTNNNINQNNNIPNPDLILEFTASYPDATEMPIFEDTWIASVTLTNTAEEAAGVELLQFYISEPMATEIKNAVLLRDGAQVSSIEQNQTAGFFFQIENQSINPGESAVFKFQALLAGGLCKESLTSFGPDMYSMRARGIESGDLFTFASSGEPILGNPTRTITGNAISVGPGPDNPVDGEVMQYSSDFEFSEISLFAGENATIDSMRYLVKVSCPVCLGDFKLLTKNASDEWVVIAGPEEPNNWTCSGDDCLSTFTDQFDINKCEELRVTATLDVDQMPIGHTIRVSVDASGIQATSEDTQEPVPPEHIVYLGDPLIWGNNQVVTPYQNP